MRLTKSNNNISTFNAVDQIFNELFEPFSIFKEPNIKSNFLSVSRYPVRKNNLSDGAIQIEFDVPGYDKSEINLLYEDETLHVSSKNNKNLNYKIYVPNLDVTTIKATCDKGVLLVTAVDKQLANKHIIEIK